MSYIRQRMNNTSRTDIELTPLKAEIEAIFSERNIDEDCDTIASLLSPYQKLVSSSLSQGRYAEAVTILLWRQSFLPSRTGISQMRNCSS